MKTKTSKVLASIMLFFTMYGIAQVPPPCSYDIYNNTGCNLAVTVTYYNSLTCAVCTVPLTQTVLANNSANYGCGQCGIVCDILVEITMAGTITLSPVPAVYVAATGSPYQFSQLPNVNACTGCPNGIQISVTPSAVTIDCF